MPISGHHSNFYIGPIGGNSSTYVYFDVDPVPLPTFNTVRTISKVKCVRANTPTGIQSGASVVYDFGAAETDAVINITVPFSTRATLISLETLYATVAPVWFYNAHENYYVKCAWNSLTSTIYPGTKDLYSMQIQLTPIGSRFTSRGAD